VLTYFVQNGQACLKNWCRLVSITQSLCQKETG